MPKSETSIILPPEIGKAVLPIIKDSVSKEDYQILRRLRTVDAVGAGSGNALVDITIIVATSSPACLAIASILRTWIRATHSKKVTLKTEKGSIEFENLSSEDLMQVIKECKEIKFENR
ncbi:hypothetical protein B8Z58_005062 [Enterobacter roggenkampii]|nr:hypothetical protein [Enterobacter roggenkampii]